MKAKFVVHCTKNAYQTYRELPRMLINPHSICLLYADKQLCRKVITKCFFLQTQLPTLAILVFKTILWRKWNWHLHKMARKQLITWEEPQQFMTCVCKVEQFASSEGRIKFFNWKFWSIFPMLSASQSTGSSHCTHQFSKWIRRWLTGHTYFL